MSADSVTLAAQADLVLLTVDMLRSPQSHAELKQSPWYELPPNALDELVRAGLGEESALSIDVDTQENRPDGTNGATRTASVEAVDEQSQPSPRSALAEVQRCAQSLEFDVWSDEYWRLFDGSTACPLNQASYIRRDKGTILGDLSGFYHAFGWQGSTTQGERPDHLLCQLEFTAMLLALAARAPDAQSHEVVMDALAQFARVHMHDWLPSVCWQMCEASQIEYFGAVAQWTLILWQALTELHAWPIDQVPEQHAQPITDPENPYECGAPDLHQIQL